MDDEPDEIEALLPWYAAGTLNVHDAHRVADALKHDLALQKQYATIQDEYAETIHLNESLGAPSTRAMQKLFAAIDAEPARKSPASLKQPTRFGAFLSSLSPRTLAWSASLGAAALVLQAGVIGTVLMRSGLGSFQSAAFRQGVSQPPPALAVNGTVEQPASMRSSTSSASAPRPATDTASRERSVASAPPQDAPAATSAPAPKAVVAQSAEQPGTQSQAARAPRPQIFSRSLGANKEVVAAVTFKPDARMSDISALFGSYHAKVVGNDGSTFRLQFEGMTTANDLAVLLSALRNERVVAAAESAP
jgi:hypothetical protein